tara:strand:- start:1629 stop:2888 length:1260 start_codon:yes stop_codon:yes gene_type:complete
LKCIKNRIMDFLFYIIIISAIIFEYLISSLSTILNMKSISAILPEGFEKVYNKNKYAKSQKYLKINSQFSLFSSSFSFFIIMIIIHFGVFGFLDDFVRAKSSNSIYSGLIFFGILFIINDIINLPFSFFKNFVIEEKFGFNKMTISIFIKDKLKSYLLVFFIGGITMFSILSFFYYFETYGWLMVWIFLTIFSIIIQPIFIHFIAPMFNKFSPLDDGELKSAITKYSKEINFPISRIDVMDGSKRSNHSNAYFTGFGKSKRIALFDTLINNHTTEEIVSVVAHEAGHYKKKHIFFGMILSIIQTGLMLFLFNFIINEVALYNVFGVSEPSIYTGLVFFGLLFTPLNMILSLISLSISRKNEFEADQYALDTTNNPQALISMLKGLASDNLSHLTPHPFTVFLQYTHPPIYERVKKIEKK